MSTFARMPRHIDDQRVERIGERTSRPSDGDHEIGNGLPFGLPPAKRAFVFLQHRGQHGGDKPRHAERRRDRRPPRAPDFVCAAWWTIRRRRLPAREPRQLPSARASRDRADFPGRPGRDAERAGERRQTIAVGVPRHRRHGQRPASAETRGNGRPAIAERGECARRAAELQDRRIAQRGLDSRRGAIERVAPPGGLEPKCDRRRLLQPRAPRHVVFAWRSACRGRRVGSPREVAQRRSALMRSCSTSAVSMMSWLVAPQCTYRAARHRRTTRAVRWRTSGIARLPARPRSDFDRTRFEAVSALRARRESAAPPLRGMTPTRRFRLSERRLDVEHCLQPRAKP